MDLKKATLELVEALFDHIEQNDFAIKDLQTRLLRLEGHPSVEPAAAAEIGSVTREPTPVKTSSGKTGESTVYLKPLRAKYLPNAIIVVNALLSNEKVGKTLATLSEIVGVKHGATQSLMDNITMHLHFVTLISRKPRKYHIPKQRVKEAREWVSLQVEGKSEVGGSDPPIPDNKPPQQTQSNQASVIPKGFTKRNNGSVPRDAIIQKVGKGQYSLTIQGDPPIVRKRKNDLYKMANSRNCKVTEVPPAVDVILANRDNSPARRPFDNREH